MIYIEKDWYGQPCPKVGFKVSMSTQWIFNLKNSVETTANVYSTESKGFLENFDFTRRVTTNKANIFQKFLYLQHSSHSRYVSTEFFRFKVDVPLPPEKDLLAQPYEYKEGLWEQNVAEWFIVNTRTKRYLECNLSANGAWWMMAFSGVRQRNIDLLPDLSEVITQSSRQQDSWQAELEIPETLLVDILGDDEWVHNVCFILGKQPRQYISFNKLISNKPDFHRPDEIAISIRRQKRL